LSDPQPGFQGHGILTSRISQKRCVLGTKLLKNTNRKPYTIDRMVQLSMTLSDLWPRFQGRDIFHTLNISETTWDRAIVTKNVNRKSYVLYHMVGPLTRFSRSRHFWSRISQKRCILGTNLLKNTNRKPYTIHRTIPLWMTFSDLWPQFQGHDIFLKSNIVKTARLEDKVTIAQ